MADSDMDQIPLHAMSRKQRRVLGVLLEKAFTTPEQYPLTLKATTSGCNQKSNRDPVVNYDEETVFNTLDQLQKLGFTGTLHTEGGRTERYRHFMRHRTKLTEPQLAIITELLLRGKQQLGELRTRASRMVPIDSQDVLKRELQTLMEQGLIRANGSLERRGIEVDHNLYADGENVEPLSEYHEEATEVAVTTPRPASSSTGESSRVAALEAMIESLKDDISTLKDRVSELSDDVDSLRRQLGG